MTFDQWICEFCRRENIRTHNQLKYSVVERNFSNFADWMEDEGMVARCFCHEIDHLDGHMFDELCDKLYTMEEVEKMFQDAAEEGRKELEEKEAE